MQRASKMKRIMYDPKLAKLVKRIAVLVLEYQLLQDKGKYEFTGFGHNETRVAGAWEKDSKREFTNIIYTHVLSFSVSYGSKSGSMSYRVIYRSFPTHLKGESFHIRGFEVILYDLALDALVTMPYLIGDLEEALADLKAEMGADGLDGEDFDDMLAGISDIV